jgi:dihydrolipoamide dehydrogenase
MSENFDAIVIGGGPGGYVCAIRLAQLGFKTACIESRGTLGGTCLNIGCIPSKSLLSMSDNYYKALNNFSDIGIEVEKINLNLSKMMKNKEKSVSVLTKGIEFLFKKNKVAYIKGTASLKSNNQVVVKENSKKTIYNTKNIIISTGSLPVSLPGIDFDEKQIVSSTGALSLKTIPKKMVIVGGGYIGLEMGSVWARLGSEVHVIEFLDHIIPGMDLDISKEFQKSLTKQGINFFLKTKVEKIVKQKNFVKVYTSGKEKKEFNCEVVLISVGRKPNTKELNLEENKIKLDKQKRIEVDKEFKTSVPNILL